MIVHALSSILRCRLPKTPKFMVTSGGPLWPSEPLPVLRPLGRCCGLVIPINPTQLSHSLKPKPQGGGGGGGGGGGCRRIMCPFGLFGGGGGGGCSSGLVMWEANYEYWKLDCVTAPTTITTSAAAAASPTTLHAGTARAMLLQLLLPNLGSLVGSFV